MTCPSRRPASIATHLSSKTSPAGAGGDDGGGQVGQLAVVAPGPGGDDGEAAGPQQHRASGQDAGEPGEQLVQVLVGEIGGIVTVAVVVLLDTAPGVGADLAVDAGAIGRRGDHQRDRPGGGRAGERPDRRASPSMTVAVPDAPSARALRTLAAARSAQRGSYSTPRP